MSLPRRAVARIHRRLVRGSGESGLGDGMNEDSIHQSWSRWRGACRQPEVEGKNRCDLGRPTMERRDGEDGR
jgi:hypothetical protein